VIYDKCSAAFVCVEFHGARDGQRLWAEDSVGKSWRQSLVGLATRASTTQHHAGTNAYRLYITGTYISTSLYK